MFDVPKPIVVSGIVLLAVNAAPPAARTAATARAAKMLKRLRFMVGFPFHRSPGPCPGADTRWFGRESLNLSHLRGNLAGWRARERPRATRTGLTGGTPDVGRALARNT